MYDAKLAQKGTGLRIREKLRTGKKLEKYERTWYSKNRDLVHLRPKFSKAEEELIEAWA